MGRCQHDLLQDETLREERARATTALRQDPGHFSQHHRPDHQLSISLAGEDARRRYSISVQSPQCVGTMHDERGRSARTPPCRPERHRLRL